LPYLRFGHVTFDFSCLADFDFHITFKIALFLFIYFLSFYLPLFSIKADCTNINIWAEREPSNIHGKALAWGKQAESKYRV